MLCGTLKCERTQHEWPHMEDQEFDTYLRFMSLARKNSFWSFAIRQRLYVFTTGSWFVFSTNLLTKSNILATHILLAFKKGYQIWQMSSLSQKHKPILYFYTMKRIIIYFWVESRHAKVALSSRCTQKESYSRGRCLQIFRKLLHHSKYVNATLLNISLFQSKLDTCQE